MNRNGFRGHNRCAAWALALSAMESQRNFLSFHSRIAVIASERRLLSPTACDASNRVLPPISLQPPFIQTSEQICFFHFVQQLWEWEWEDKEAYYDSVRQDLNHICNAKHEGLVPLMQKLFIEKWEQVEPVVTAGCARWFKEGSMSRVQAAGLNAVHGGGAVANNGLESTNGKLKNQFDRRSRGVVPVLQKLAEYIRDTSEGEFGIDRHFARRSVDGPAIAHVHDRMDDSRGNQFKPAVDGGRMVRVKLKGHRYHTLVVMTEKMLEYVEEHHNITEHRAAGVFCTKQTIDPSTKKQDPS